MRLQFITVEMTRRKMTDFRILIVKDVQKAVLYRAFLLFSTSANVHKIVISQYISSSDPSFRSEIITLQRYVSRNNGQFVFFTVQALNLFIEKLIFSIFENFQDSGDIMNSCYHWHKTAFDHYSFLYNVVAGSFLNEMMGRTKKFIEK